MNRGTCVESGDWYPIQLTLYKADESTLESGRLLFKTNVELKQALQRQTDKSHIRTRQISFTVIDLEPGNYVLIPSLFKAGNESTILIQTWASSPISISELVEKGEPPNSHTIVTLDR